MKDREFQTSDDIITAAKEETTYGSTNSFSPQARLKLLNSILANAPLMLWAVDRNGKILICEGKGLESIGRKPDECGGMSLLEIHKDHPKFENMLQRSLQGESFCSTEKTKMGTKGIAFENWQGPLHGPDGEIVGVAGVAVDITHRQKTEDDLRAKSQQMERLLDSHERDRRLTAYEIHDGLVQDATGAQMQLETLLQTDPDLSDRAQSILGTCQELIRKTVIEARHLISGLRPPILDELGLVPAIRHMVNSCNDRGGKVTLNAELSAHRFDPLLEVAVFRIAQEAITNALRHSQSDEVEVRLTQADPSVELEIVDRGIGFDPSNIEETRFGIQGMRERARLLRGQMEIDSSPGNGTRVFVKMPITPISEVGGDR